MTSTALIAKFSETAKAELAATRYGMGGLSGARLTAAMPEAEAIAAEAGVSPFHLLADAADVLFLDGETGKYVVVRMTAEAQ